MTSWLPKPGRASNVPAAPPALPPSAVGHPRVQRGCPTAGYRAAMLLYVGTLAGCAGLQPDLVPRRPRQPAGRRLTPGFLRDVSNRYLLGLVAYAAATLLALNLPLLTVIVSVRWR